MTTLAPVYFDETAGLTYNDGSGPKTVPMPIQGTAGKVTMLQNAGVWTVYKPDGTVLNTAGSTTQGLQEAINFACTPLGTAGYDLEVIGAEDATGGAAVIQCTSQLKFPPIQGKKIRFGAVTLNFPNTVTGYCVIFDSMMMLDFDLAGGQIVCSGQSGVLIKPTVGVPVDKIVAVTVSRLHFQSIAMLGSTVGPAITIDCSLGSADAIDLTVQEILGGTYGLQVIPGTKGFVKNFIQLRNVHQQTIAGVLIGSASDGGNCYGNNFKLCLAPATGAIGVDTFGTDDLFEVAIVNNEGQPTIGMKFEAGAGGNVYRIARNNATTQVSGSGNTAD